MRILVVDDDAMQRRAAVRSLLAGGIEAEIIEADSGQSCFALILRDHYDCVLLDYRLPGADGLEVLRQVRAAGNTTPIVIMTGDGDERTAVAAIKAGATDYLSKARLDFDTLRQTLRSAIRVASAEADRKDAELRYRLLFEQAPFGVFLVDPADKRIIEFNRAAHVMLGYSAEEFASVRLKDILPAAKLVGLDERLRRVLETGAGDYESQVITRDGSIRDVQVSIRILEIEGKALTHAVFHDITERKRHEAELERRQKQFERIADATPDILYVYDVDTNRNVFCNTRVQDVLGYTPEQINAMSDHLLPRLVHPDDLQRVMERYDSPGILLTDEAYEIEYRMLHADGTWRWMRGRDVVFDRHPDGSTAQLLGVARDVTNRRLVEERLRRSEQFVRSVLNSMSAHVAVLNSEGSIIAVNEAWERFAREQQPAQASWIGANYLDISGRATALDPAVNEVVKGLQQVLAGESPGFSFEYPCPLPEGIRWFILNASPLPREIGGAVVSHVDVTDRKLAQEAAYAGTERLRRLARNVPAVLWTTDLELRITSSTGGALAVLGEKENQWAGQMLSDTLGNTPAGESILDAHRRAARGESIGYETEYGGRRFHAHVEPFRDAAGQTVGAIGVALDMTAEKQLQEQLAHSQKMESIGRLAGGIAHDFNNLLAIISGYAESLTRHISASDPLRRHVDEIVRASEQGASLTRQLLSFSRRQLVTPKLVDLGQVLGGVQRMLGTIMGDKVRLKITPGGGKHFINADPSQMEQVVVNLALNARDAMPEGGTFSVETGEVAFDDTDASARGLAPGRYVRIAAVDTGIGMDETTRSRAFEPFFTTKGRQGTGLGLSIVYGIVKQYGGHVWVNSRPGQGSVFEICLPVAQSTVSAQSV